MNRVGPRAMYDLQLWDSLAVFRAQREETIVDMVCSTHAVAPHADLSENVRLLCPLECRQRLPLLPHPELRGRAQMERSMALCIHPRA